MIYFSAQSMGFYDDAVHSPGDIPPDAIAVDPQTHRTLLVAQSEGLQIVADEQGLPQAVDPASLLTLDEARAARQAAVSAAFVVELAKGCQGPKGWVDCDEQAQGRISRIIQMRREAAALDIPQPPTVTWTMFDKSRQPHDDAELIALGLAVGARFQALFAAKQALEDAVRDAAMRQELDAIDIAGGWPS